MASIPGSACSPVRGFRAISSPHCNETSCSRTPAGVGALLNDQIVRLVLVLKAASLAQGYSGVRPQTVEALCALIEHEIYPCIPWQGSVGASGDLAPLAHMALALIGVGDVRVTGKQLRRGCARASRAASRWSSGPRRDSRCSTARRFPRRSRSAGLLRIEDNFAAAIVAGALSVDAIKGSDVPVRRAHPQPAAPARTATGRGCVPRAARRQPHPCLARAMRAGSGSLLACAASRR